MKFGKHALLGSLVLLAGWAGAAGAVETNSQPPPAISKPLVEPRSGIEFVRVEGGCFQMGCGDWQIECGEDEKPAHRVCVDSFWLGKYEVTQGQWKKIMGNNPSDYPAGDEYPVEMVSWYDAQRFIAKLNELSGGQPTFRLPTEVEWEYAARSGGKNEIYAGGNFDGGVFWHKWEKGKPFYPQGQTQPVGSSKPNGLGLYDMSGNVYEWVQDWYRADWYANTPLNNTHGPQSGNGKVVRGGHHPSHLHSLRTTSRYTHPKPDWTSLDLGFRLAADPVR